MLYYTEFKGYTPAVVGKKIKYDNNIFSFDIESTSYIVLHGKQLETSKYLDLTDKEKDDCIFKTTMYIWQFSVNDTVYYGRTWQDFVHFLKMLNDIDPTTCKIVFVHNLAFEFQFLKSVVHFKNVFARKSHKVMKADLVDFNIQFRCSYFMSNCSLEQLAKVYNLDVQKLKGNLDYSKIRHFKTPLTKAELDYCSNDCLVVYEYIKMELKEYKQVNLLPLTSTGKVRRELQKKVENDKSYYQETFNAINIDPVVYDKLVQSFMGGYTHANYCYTDKIIPNVTSYDFTSSYPYVLLVEKYPMTQFRKCNIKSIKALSPKFAYIITIEFKEIESQYMNNFISQSKCKIRNGEYDNGRVIRAESLEITCTDVDLYIILASYNYKSYKIIDCYYAIYDYLPIQYVNFILDKYENKTKYKGLNGYETEYSKAKNLFNSLYGMTVTNLICDETIYEDSTGEWQEKELTNDQIKKKLLEERKKAFLSFSWGVWVTAHARRNLIENIMKLDRYCLYADTDSVKLKQGFDPNVIENYNKKVVAKIEDVCRKRNLKIDRFKPTDSKGKEHLIGVFDFDGFCSGFITQGAKKYCVEKTIPNEKIQEKYQRVIKSGENESTVLELTVAGVPKQGIYQIKSLKEFKDDLVFEFKNTNKNLLIYCENQDIFDLTDYLGNTETVTDISGCSLIPTTYLLSKSLEYADLISDESTKRARFNYYE